MKYIYPALFENNNDEDMSVSVTFPDIFGGVTCGKNFDDAMFMAKDLLKILLTTAPAQCENPSTIEQMKCNFPNKQIVMVEVEL